MASGQNSQNKRGFWAVLSIGLAIFSLGSKYLYVRWHSDLFLAQIHGMDITFPTWWDVGLAGSVAQVNAVLALALAGFAYTFGPRRLGFVALILAIASFLISLTIC
jgi:hypothetical protein